MSDRYSDIYSTIYSFYGAVQGIYSTINSFYVGVAAISSAIYSFHKLLKLSTLIFVLFIVLRIPLITLLSELIFVIISFIFKMNHSTTQLKRDLDSFPPYTLWKKV